MHENTNHEIDLRDLFLTLWESKLLIFTSTTFFLIVAIIYSLSLPNLYLSTAILNPVDQNTTSQTSQSFGGLATLAGLNIPQSLNNKESIAIEKAQSLSFFSDHIMPNIFLPNLMAIKSWDAENNIQYDSSLYNISTQTWLRDSSYPKNLIPSAQESFKVFKKIVQISYEEESGMVKISVKHQSPFIAKKWTELVVTELNNFFRTKDKVETSAAMDYLNTQIAETSYTEIRQVIAALLEQKMQQMTLIESNEYYIFEYLDPPVVMEEKVEPKRSSLSILGAFFGALLGIMISLILSYFTSRRS